MTRPSGTSEPWQVVVVPYPFVERGGTKRRPALAIGSEGFAPSGHALLAMITTAVRRPWPGDTELLDHRDAGLRRPCIVRLKLFTLDRRLIRRTVGRLSERDRERVLASLCGCLALAGQPAGKVSA